MVSSNNKKLQAGAKNPIPYIDDLDQALLDLSPCDPFTLRDAVTHTHIFGGTGSGKTSGSGKTFAKSFLQAGFGGLVLCPNPDERALWEQYASETGRSNHLLVIDDSGDNCFNFLHYELNRPAIAGNDAGHMKRVENMVSVLMNVMEQAEGGGVASNSNDQTWISAAEILLKNALAVVSALPDVIPRFNFEDIKKHIANAPNELKLVGTPQFAKTGFALSLDLAQNFYESKDEGEDFRAVRTYWTSDYPSMSDRTRSSVLFTLDSILQNMPTGTMRRLYSSGTNFFPEDSFNGAIIILDLPAIDAAVNGMAQTLFKTVWQDAVLRREKTDSMRPVFLWADEAQLFISKSDARFMALARQKMAASIFMTQNIHGYYNKMGGQKNKSQTDQMLGNFQTQIFHTQTDKDTIEFAMAKFGKRDRFKVGLNAGTNEGRARGHTSGRMKGRSDTINEGGTSGSSLNTVTEDAVRPEQFNTLKNGSPKNDFKVQGLIHKAGYNWKYTGENLLVAEFSQKI